MKIEYYVFVFHVEIALVADSCYIYGDTTQAQDTSVCVQEEPGIKPLTRRFRG